MACGYIQPAEGTRLEYYPPTAGVVVTESFARAHCFRAIEDEAEDRVGLAFEPLPDGSCPMSRERSGWRPIPVPR